MDRSLFIKLAFQYEDLDLKKAMFTHFFPVSDILEEQDEKIREYSHLLSTLPSN
jgi:hypothetical protein